MRPGLARRAALLAALCGCASSVASTRRTRVDREERVTADTEARTQWFATLHVLQRLLASADARRLEVLGPLRVMLCRPPDATLSDLAAAAQARMASTGVARVRTRLRRLPESEQALGRWLTATRALAGDAVERESLIAVEETLVVERVTPSGAEAIPLRATPAPAVEPRCEPGAAAGTEGADGSAVLAQLAVVLRRAAAQALMLERAQVLAAQLSFDLGGGSDAGAQGLSAGAPPALAAEFVAAERAIAGVAARATMHLHETARTEQWARAALAPEGEEAPEEAPAEGGP